MGTLLSHKGIPNMKVCPLTLMVYLSWDTYYREKPVVGIPMGTFLMLQRHIMGTFLSHKGIPHVKVCPLTLKEGFG